MDGPCFDVNTWPTWAFVAVAILSHARGTALLMREAGLFLGRFVRRRRELRRRRKPRY